MFLFNIDFILFPIFAPGDVGKRSSTPVTYYILCLIQIIAIYCSTTPALILITYKESSAQPEQPGAQPEVLGRALLVVARTRVVTKGDRAFAVKAPKVCKWAVSGDKASQNAFLFKSPLKAHLYSVEMYQRNSWNMGIHIFITLG